MCVCVLINIITYSWASVGCVLINIITYSWASVGWSFPCNTDKLKDMNYPQKTNVTVFFLYMLGNLHVYHSIQTCDWMSFTNFLEDLSQI